MTEEEISELIKKKIKEGLDMEFKVTNLCKGGVVELNITILYEGEEVCSAYENYYP